MEYSTIESESLVQRQVQGGNISFSFLRVAHLGIDVWKLVVGGECASNAKYNCQTDSKQVLWRKIEIELWKES